MPLPKHLVHLLSGGMDSVALLYEHAQDGFSVHCVGMDYGQHHRDELRLAKIHAEKLGFQFTIVELLQVKYLFKRSAITDGNGSNIVPNRNAVFLHIAAGIAASTGAEIVTIGCNKDDAADFPDCRPEFIAAMNETLKAAEVSVEICAPYINLTKRQIVQRARQNKWPIEDSISCYNGNNCGKCDACKKRAIALT